MQRKIIPLFFVVLFLFNSAGYFVFFKFRQEQIRHEIKLKLIRSVPENELTVLSFKLNSEEYKNLEWKEPHEFRYKGRMYDISYQETDKHGIIHFHCINDTQEDKLFANLDEQVNNHIANNSKSSKGKKSISKKVSDDFFCRMSFPFFIPTGTKNPFFVFCPAITQITVDIPTPPPDSAI